MRIVRHECKYIVGHTFLMRELKKVAYIIIIPFPAYLDILNDERVKP